jgi:mannose-6-phosphate isomerase-like protein (cupin superfamily)
MMLKPFFTLLGCSLFLSAQNAVDYVSNSELHQLAGKLASKSKTTGGFASETLAKYGNHLMMLAHREATGSSELHEKDADIFVVVEGEATLVTGGKLVNSHTAEPGEERGSSIDGGQSQNLGPGDVIHIHAKTPHQLHIAAGHPFTYFVVKIKE